MVGGSPPARCESDVLKIETFCSLSFPTLHRESILLILDGFRLTTCRNDADPRQQTKLWFQGEAIY